MLVAEEEHDGARIVQLVHLIKIFSGPKVEEKKGLYSDDKRKLRGMEALCNFENNFLIEVRNFADIHQVNNTEVLTLNN